MKKIGKQRGGGENGLIAFESISQVECEVCTISKIRRDETPDCMQSAYYTGVYPAFAFPSLFSGRTFKDIA